MRTPKFSEAKPGRLRALFRAIRLTKIETLLGISLLTVAIMNVTLIKWDDVAPASVLLPIWTSMYALFFLCSPIYAYMSYRTLVPMKYDRVEPSDQAHQETEGDLVKFEALPDAARKRTPTSARRQAPGGRPSGASRATGDTA